MKQAKPLILLGVLSLAPAAAAAQDATAAPVDTSKWLCKLCKFESGTSGSVEVGAGNVSDASAKFGEYNGLDEKGGYLIGGAAARHRDAGGTYWNARAADLGLDTRSAAFDGGRQGAYGLSLSYDEIPHIISDSAQTPFLGIGGASLTVPFLPAATTGAMPLAGTLHTVDIGTKRKRLGIGASWLPQSGWKYALSLRHESREGTKRASGAFFVTAAQLVEPVDYDTDQIDASASYTGRRLQAKLAYYGSRFADANDALRWQNPFSLPAFPGATAGQRALPPDNQFHQLSATLGYQLTERTRASADIAWGRMTQDESFLAPTLNATLAVPALPRGSLGGRVDTLNAGVKLTSALTERLGLNASYAHDERDNRTPQATYSWVTTDMFVSPTPRTNLPYSFTRDLAKLSGDYRFSPRLRASVGADHDRVKRTFQEVDRTRENTIWGKANARALENIDLTLKLAHAERRNGGYQAAPGVTPPENPLLRKYNMASRDRDSAGLRADIAVTERLSVGLEAGTSKDDYFDSPIGLTGATDTRLNGDASFMLSEQTSLSAFASRETIKSTQAGSEFFAEPDWTAENHDTVEVLGIGVRHAAIKDKLDLGADYTLTRTRGELRLATAAPAPGFPDFTTKLRSLRLYATYRIDKKISLHGGYWHERYSSADWMLDGVAPATIPNVLTLGEQPAKYSVDVVQVSLRYAF
jgi:MtrB/PioB family decaheme-associated outer membrane protein